MYTFGYIFVCLTNACFSFSFQLYFRIVTKIKFTCLIPEELISFASFHSSFHLMSAYSHLGFMACSFYIYLKNYQIWFPGCISSFCERHSHLSSWHTRNIRLCLLSQPLFPIHATFYNFTFQVLSSQFTSLFLHFHSHILYLHNL